MSPICKWFATFFTMLSKQHENTETPLECYMACCMPSVCRISMSLSSFLWFRQNYFAQIQLFLRSTHICARRNRFHLREITQYDTHARAHESLMASTNLANLAIFPHCLRNCIISFSSFKSVNKVNVCSAINSPFASRALHAPFISRWMETPQIFFSIEIRKLEIQNFFLSTLLFIHCLPFITNWVVYFVVVQIRFAAEIQFIHWFPSNILIIVSERRAWLRTCLSVSRSLLLIN